MNKSNKLTYKELAHVIVNNEDKVKHAINTLGRMVYDYIEFSGDNEKFAKYLKNKYKEVKDDVLQHKQGKQQYSEEEQRQSK